MSGWDTGQVFVSGAPAGGVEEAEGDIRTIASRVIQRKFVEFLRNFQSQGVFIYRDRLRRRYDLKEYYIEVSIDHMLAFDEELASNFLKDPNECLPLFELGAKEAAQIINVAEVEANFQVLFSWSSAPSNIRDLQSSQVSQIVCVRGIVISASRTRAKATHLNIVCSSCGASKTLPVRPGFSGAQLPRKCDNDAGPANAGRKQCPLDPYVINPDKSYFVDQQTLKLQESPETVPTGEMPRHLLLSVDRYIANRVSPGTRIRIVGIFSIFQAASQRPKGMGGSSGVALRQPYLRVLGMTTEAEGASHTMRAWDPSEESLYKELAARPDCYEKITRSIDPAIFGHDDIKKGIATLLFSGSRKTPPTGTKVRGDINVLLLGDPSTAKSQFLKFAERLAPIGVYTSGKGSSAAGLTASVIRDASSGEFYLEGGSMVLADGGIVCIDEFDKMRDQDRVAIHEAMEQQTISIAKAGITTVLNSRTAVLAAANPLSGRYDDMKTATEQIDFQNTILSRFDMIFIVRDIRDEEKDQLIARHVLNVHMNVTPAATASERRLVGRELIEADDLDIDFFRRYISYCKAKCAPRISPEAAKTLENYFVRIRSEMRERTRDTRMAGIRAIPVTVRQLEAIVRISEALAKMRLSRVATEEHVAEAIRLFRVSTMEAANSGMLQVDEYLPPEVRMEVQRAEAAISRMIEVGGTASTRSVVDALKRQGFRDFSCQKALYAMSARNDIEYRNQKRLFVRKK